MLKKIINLFFTFFIINPLFSISIQEFSVKNQIGKSIIDNEKKEVLIQLPYLTDLSKVEFGWASFDSIPSEIVIHNEESYDFGSEIKIPQILDLRKGFKIDEWTVKGCIQLPESDFSKWHTENITGFLTIGTVSCSEMPGTEQIAWDNGNPAYSTSGSKRWPTQRIQLSDGSFAAELITRRVVGVIASGNLFTGRVVRNMSLKQLLGFTDKDGKDLIDWGVPFTARPKGIRVKFCYNGFGDECSIVATLENRCENNGKLERKYVATAAYIGSTDNANKTSSPTRISEPDSNGLRTLELDFLYGINPENTNPFPKGVTQATKDTDITHVNVVFASSAKGDYFKGVKNARLIIKDFEFVY